MASPHLLAGLGTIVVGGGLAAGLGFAFIPADKNPDNTTSNAEVIEPPNFQHSTNYLVVAYDKLPNDKTAKPPCTLNTDCQLFNRQTKKLVSNEQVDEIRPGNVYVLNTNTDSLNGDDYVELTISKDKKFYLLVKSTPSKDKSISIKPIKPSKIMEKNELAAKQKTFSSNTDDQTTLETQHFYNLQVDTYITRPNTNHESFVIIEWNSSTSDTLNNPLLVSNSTRVDAYVFKNFEDQEKEKIYNPELLVEINNIKDKNFVEIYEIQNQELLKAQMTELKTKTTISSQPDWDALAKENVMLTKLSKLKDGKYYKLVFKDFSKIEQKFDTGVNNLKISLKYSDSYEYEMLKKQYLENNYYCAKFSKKSGLANKCTKFKIPPPPPYK